jgi:outer membrane protein OmpA-like peptidoglycan-associated protein
MQQKLTTIFAILFVLSLYCCSHLYAEPNANQDSKAKSENLAVKDNGLYLYKAVLESPPAEGSGSGIQQDDKKPAGADIFDRRRIRIINLGPVINHKGVDYAPTISADGKTLFYVSNRPGSKLNSDDKPSHDFWAAKKNDRLDSVFFTPYNIDTTTIYGLVGVNTPLNEGAASIAADKQSLYFTGCNRPDGLGDCDIYKTTIEGDKWSRPTNLGKNVNSKNFDSQPSIAPDQSRIYFVSTREGPNSDGENEIINFDIWYCDWDAELEEWKPAQNLKEINTKGQDASPFIAADNSTLFFASDGHKPNYGGLDFYVTRYDRDTKTWSTPENLEPPINTPEDDYFITLPASGDIIYFSSRRTDLPGFQGDLDVFMAYVPSFFRTSIVKGTVVDECSGEFIPSTITIRNPVTGRVEHDSLTFNKQEFQIIISNPDYGEIKDSIKFVTLEITAENPKYGKTMKAQRVDKPAKTIDPEELKKVAFEYYVKLTLGQMPVLGTEIDEATYVKNNKDVNPELASYRGLVMEEFKTWEIYPLLNYVFFDLGSSKIPDRYILFSNPSETPAFNDTSIAGGTLDKYYHLLNIYGFRLNQHPEENLEIVGCNDGKTPEEKKPNLSKERAQNVYDYLKNVWNISEKRMKLTVRNEPQVVSNPKDSLGITENRRVELWCKEWEVVKPVFNKDPKTFPQPETMTFTMQNGIEDAIIAKRRIEIKRGEQMWKVLPDVGITDEKKPWDWRSEQGKYPKDEVPYTAQLIVTTKSGAECKSPPINIPVMQVTTEKKKVDVKGDSTLEIYSLILFPFDRADAGPLNERIMRDYVYERILPTSVVEVIGHTDVVGMYDHNKALSDRRSTTVFNGINQKTKSKYAKLDRRGVGEDEPLYDNALPECRFYNRTVQVRIKTPVKDWEAKRE